MRCTVTRNTFPGRSHWLLCVTTGDGRCLTSWHRTKSGAELEAARLAKETHEQPK